MQDKDYIAVIGLGYVGLPLAVEFGKLSDVVGFDIDAQRINELKQMHDKTGEIAENQLRSSRKLSLTSSLNDIQDANIYIVTVPTPIDENNKPDLSFLKEASRIIGSVVKKDNIIIFESTVYPGCTEEICIPIIEDVSSLKYEVDFFCGYSPERINPGDKERTIRNITKIVSGSNKIITNRISEIYETIIDAGVYKAKSIKVAEAAKVIENTQRDLNIALINELSKIFNKLNIDTSEVLDAAETKWNFSRFNPGIVGGHCIGVDPYYLTYKSQELGYIPEVILAGREINDGMSKYSVDILINLMHEKGINPSESKVALLGFTFKENCPDIRNTKVLDIVKELQLHSIDFDIYDPWADKDEVEKLYDLKIYSGDIKDNYYDVIFVAVGHTQFRQYNPAQLKSKTRLKDSIIVDLKSIYKKNELLELGFKVFRL